MKPLSPQTRRAFAQWGARGGQARARRLAAPQRRTIAAQAARARWQTAPPSTGDRASIRLNAPYWDDPVYIEELLSEGTLHDWRALYQRIMDHPFGRTATALTQVLAANTLYGVTPLWRGLLAGAQGAAL